MIIKAIFLFLFLNISILYSQETKIYVKDIQFKSEIKAELAKKIENLLVLNIINQFPEALVMSDDASVSILKHGKFSQNLSGEAEFLNFLSNSLQFNELITSNIQLNQKTFQLSVQRIQLNQNTKNFQIIHKVVVDFQEWEIAYLMTEVIKALKDKTYKPIRVQLESETQLKFLEIKIPTVKSGDLQPMNFTYNDEVPITFMEGVSTYVQQGDTKFKSKQYLDASSTYQKILDSISSLQVETKTKLSPLIDTIQKRVKTSNSALYKDTIENLDSKLPKTFHNTKQAELKNYIQNYVQTWEDYKKLPAYSIEDPLKNAILFRIEKLVKLYVQKMEADADENYQKLNFKTAFDTYRQIGSELKYYSQHIQLNELYLKIINKINTVKISGTSYINSKVNGYLKFAESENSRSILEANMKNKSKQIDHKNNATEFMELSKEIIQKNNDFVNNEIIQKYNKMGESINLDNKKVTNFSLKNILLLPIRYIGNIFLGIADIFVFKFGFGIGAGAEIGIFGGSPVIINNMRWEVSSAYGVHTTIANAYAPLHSTIVNQPNKNKDMHGQIGLYGMYNGTCLSILLRLCEKEPTAHKISSLDKIDFKKYSMANVSVAFGPSVYVGIEFHRLLELVGVVFFQDWDLFDFKEYTRDRLRYFPVNGGVELLKLSKKK